METLLEASHGCVCSLHCISTSTRLFSVWFSTCTIFPPLNTGPHSLSRTPYFVLNSQTQKQRQFSFAHSQLSTVACPSFTKRKKRIELFRGGNTFLFQHHHIRIAIFFLFLPLFFGFEFSLTTSPPPLEVGKSPSLLRTIFTVRTDRICHCVRARWSAQGSDGRTVRIIFAQILDEGKTNAVQRRAER